MALYALTVLVSSFLLFLVQPVIAKQIVPWFGGSAAVWTTCLTFFQLVLLAGYAYSDFVQRLRPKTQSLLHAVLLIISLAALPIVAGTQWKPSGSEDPLWRILGLLGVTIGLPYFMLSTTGPLIQSWFAREHHDPVIAQRAYRLFALSNFGSLMGLLAYPFAIEPWVTTRTQALGWSVFYGLFVLLTLGVALRAMRAPLASAGLNPQSVLSPQTVAPRFSDHLLWSGLAALATMLLLAVSSHITQNIASIPFLWVLPLSLYLLTFVLAFEGRGGRGWYLRVAMIPALVLAAAMAWALLTDDGILSIEFAIPLFLTGLFVVCLFCHGELAQSKPAPQFLTRFYFMIALGGAVGGLFVSVFAPRIFSAYWELPLALILTGSAGLWIAMRYLHGFQRMGFASIALASIAVCSYFASAYHDELSRDNVFASRNFYGTLHIKEGRRSGGNEPVRRLVHGVILHGLQDFNEPWRRQPTSYYGMTSGAGIAITELGRQHPAGIRVGVIGLGAGTLTVYGRAGDAYRLYEINPQVIDIAKNRFTYINDSAATVSFALGDARLVLEREPPNGFDVLLVDAFSSDAIPIHLITREALQVYIRQLKPDGVVAFHVTNRYLNLAPVVKRLADAAGYQAVLVPDEPMDELHGLMAMSDWVLVTRNERLLGSRALADKHGSIVEIPGLRLWTDDFNNLFQVLK